MITTPFLISILTFVAIIFFVLWIFSYSNYLSKRQKFIEKVRQVDERLLEEEEKSFFSESTLKVRKHFTNIITKLGSFVKPKNENEISNLRKKFLTAGFRKENAPIIFYGSKALIAAILLGGFFLVRVLNLFEITPFQLIVYSILLVAIGFFLPDVWLNRKIRKRKQMIMRGFPDALDLMVVCVEAGIGLDAAINRVGEEMKFSNRIISDEFKVLSLELRAGKLRHDAMRNFAMRIGLEDVTNLISVLIQTDKFGTNVAQALKVFSDSMRTKRYQRAEELAAMLPVKLIFPLIFFIFPALFVVIIGPAVIRIYRLMFPMF